MNILSPWVGPCGWTRGLPLPVWFEKRKNNFKKIFIKILEREDFIHDKTTTTVLAFLKISVAVANRLHTSRAAARWT
jgi:hypothetical protein